MPQGSGIVGDFSFLSYWYNVWAINKNGEEKWLFGELSRNREQKGNEGEVNGKGEARKE